MTVRRGIVIGHWWGPGRPLLAANLVRTVSSIHLDRNAANISRKAAHASFDQSQG
jgi:hypothetical protein